MTMKSPQWPALKDEQRSHVDTACAAWHLHVKQNTLRAWACNGEGPIQPVRVARKLLWPTDKIRDLLGVEVAQ